jgi:hypothetical protein
MNIYRWKCVGKGLGENGMNGACEMEMSISRSRAVLKWAYFADCKHMDSQHDIYLFSAQLLGGGVFCGFLYWR